MLQPSRRSIAAAHQLWAVLYKPPESTKKRPRCISTEAAGISNAKWKPKFIRLPLIAQHELQALRARLLAGHATGALRAGFVQKCVLDFPELVAA